MRNKPLLIFGLIVIIGLIGYFGYQKSIPSSSDPNQPQINVIPTEYDFGAINYGQTVERTFQVFNKGKKDLKILSVSTSCGCTKAKISNELIPAGSQADLLVTYKTDDMTGSHAKGDQERRIFIKNNDPKNPLVIVQIKAKVL